MKKNRCSGAFVVLVFRTLFALPLAAAPASAAEPVVADPVVTQAEAMMRSGRATEAYALLVPHEERLAGDLSYDYLLGIAALDSGRPDRATLAFERVLAVDPNFAGARLDMARAYFHLGDHLRARAELDAMLALDPPPAARATIERYLQLIADAERGKKTPKTGYVEFTYGRDSNVNNSTAQSQITVPALGNLVFTLDPTNVSKADRYAMIGVGGEIAHELGDGYAVFAGGEARQRMNRNEDRFDYRTLAGRLGIAWSDEKNVVRLSATADRYDLDQQRNRQGTGLAGDWRHALRPDVVATAFASYNAFRFETTELAVNDFDQYVLGAGMLRVFGEGRSGASATLLLGHEDDRNGRADGNKDFRGVRLGGQYGWREQVDFYAAVGFQRGTYDRRNSAFQVQRYDDQRDVALGVVWRLADRWSVRPQVLYVRNASNVPINAYRRTDVSVTVRRDFR